MKRFALFGTGFWSYFQLAAWQELPDVACVAVYNRTRSKAEKLAQALHVPNVYDDPEQLLRNEQLDFIDIVSSVETHRPLVELAAAHGIPVICQKPMAPSLADAEAMVAACRAANVPFAIHENFRWQTPIRQCKQILNQGLIGSPFRARIEFISGFPVFANQPFLRDLDQFILTDLGSHILDIARFLFGDMQRLTCSIRRVHQGIRGEDVATVLLETATTTIVCSMAYAENALERECFPQTLLFIEGEHGSLELTPDYGIRITTDAGTQAMRYPPTHYPWADPAYDLVHASIVPCNANLLQLIDGAQAETTGADNLQTMRLVFAAYQSATLHQTIMV